MASNLLRNRVAWTTSAVLIATALTPVSAAPRATTAPTAIPTPTTGALAFEPETASRFRATIPNGALWLTRSEVVISEAAADAAPQSAALSVVDRVQPPRRGAALSPTTVRMQFVASAPTTRLVAADRRREVVNYLIGRDPSGWRRNVPTYSAVVYRGLYPGVDLRYESTPDGALKGTYSVAPATDPGGIRWRYAGATVRLTPSGDLALRAGGGRSARLDLVDHAPIAWQTVAGVRRPIGVRYVIGRDGAVRFALGRYDRRLPLTIDPELVYSRLPGSALDMNGAQSVATDRAGNVYLGGWTYAPTSPYATAPHPPQTILPAQWDATVLKVDPSGRTVYVTRFGGHGDQMVAAIGVDARGMLHLAGGTDARDFPTVRPVQAKRKGACERGCYDVWVASLDAATGGRFGYATYLGSRDHDSTRSLAVTADGKVYVAGEAYAPDFPVRTTAAWGRQRRGPKDAFVTLLSATGALLASTYVGTSGWDVAFDVTLDRSGNVYLAGVAGACDMPTRRVFLRCLSTESVTGRGGGFVAKLPPTLSALTWVAYLDGTASDPDATPFTAPTAVAVDRRGTVYFAGYTSSTNLPMTSNALSRRYRGGRFDGFVVAFDQRRGRIAYGTYLGGGGGSTAGSGADMDDFVCDLAITGRGDLVVAGSTLNRDYPTYRAPQPLNMGSYDAVVTVFSADWHVRYSTYWGGSSFDVAICEGGQLAVDNHGDALVAGRTRSADFPTTRDSDQPVSSGLGAPFVAAFHDNDADPLLSGRVPLPPRRPRVGSRHVARRSS
jgi:hypothetical protein